jgi:large subunit ribosomal protein L15
MLNVIKDNKGAHKKFKRRGRGIGSGKGKTSARGGKGQTARSGVALNGFEGGQTPLYVRLPKRGFKQFDKIYCEVLNITDIEDCIASKKLDPKSITIDSLKKVGALKGKNCKFKLLGVGDIKSAFTIEVHAISSIAKANIEKQGGKVIVVKH